MFNDETGSQAGRIQGANANTLFIGIVTDNVHPQGDFRVKVKFPNLPGDDASHWCRIMTFGAGSGGKGAFFLPEVNDEVVVAFMNGDFNQGVVMGSLWNGQDKPAYSNNDAKSPTGRFSGDGADYRGSADAKKNDIRSISSRAGHEFILNDNASNPRVTIHSGTKHRIVLDDAGNQPTKIEIYDGKNENFILIDTKNKKITLQSNTGDILIKAKKNVIIEADEKIITKSKSDTEMTTEANLKQTATSNVNIKASGTGEINCAGTLTIKGSTVNIN